MDSTDGRQARSHRTRLAVAEAMLDCFQDGLLRPSAKDVAERAGVSTRAVFRHFDNMEALLEEASQIQIERVMGELPALHSEGSLDHRVDALVEYSVRRNELVAPVRRAALLAEPFSGVIRKRHAWDVAGARKQVRDVLADELASLSETARRDKVAALRALLSFNYWDELRRKEKLSAPATNRVLRNAVLAILR